MKKSVIIALCAILFFQLFHTVNAQSAASTPTLHFTITEANTFYEAGQYKTNLGCVFSEGVSFSQYLYPDILQNEESCSYIELSGRDLNEAKQDGFQILFIPTAKVFQIVWGENFDDYEVGMTLHFEKGMPIYYQSNGVTNKITLLSNATYEIEQINEEIPRMTLKKIEDYSNATDGGRWSLSLERNYSISEQETGYYANVFIGDCDLKTKLTEARIMLGTSDIRNYVEGFDLSTEELVEAGLRLLLVMNDTDQVLQIQFGTTDKLLKNGSHFTLKKGLQFGGYCNGELTYFTLEDDCTLEIFEHKNSPTGFGIARTRDVQYTIPGDLDGDCLKNINDIDLMRQDLIDNIRIQEFHVLDVNQDGTYDLKDFVYCLKNWNLAEEETYGSIYSEKEGKFIAVNGVEEYELDNFVGNQNYIRITYDTNEDLHGTFWYKDVNGNLYQEEFFLSKNEVQFEHFFDNYRRNGLNVEEKTLTKISLENVGEQTAFVRLIDVGIADRDVKTDDMLYLQTQDLKIGVDLNMGGSLAYVECLKYDVVEIQDTNAREINVVADHTLQEGEDLLDDTVNLVNIYDWGRQIQQSYYIDALDETYENGSYGANAKWPYNPVQAGDQYENQSQIIDFRQVNQDGVRVIYIKTRALDWSKNNSTTRSYMENWYWIEDGNLVVDNAFINWEGFERVESISSQELPAFYAGYSFDYFVEGKDPSKRTNYGMWTVEGEYFATASITNVSPWYAWVNEDADDAFGVGIYIPCVQGCVAGRCNRSKSYDYMINCSSGTAPILQADFKYLNRQFSTMHQNAFSQNTSYIAPVTSTILQEYTKYRYSYAICVDYLDQIETSFNKMIEEERIINDALLQW